MFRKRKDGGDQGWDRISRLVEERQRELAEGAGEGDELEEDTIIMHPPAASATDAAADERPVSLFNVRGSATRGEAASQESGEPAAAVEPTEGSGAPPAAPLEAAEPAPQRLDYEPEPNAEEAATLPAAPAGWEERTVADRSRMAVPDLRRVGAGGTLVAADAVWEGKLRSAGDVRIEGTVQGEIDTAATLVVAPEARVNGTIRAHSLLIGGEVEGDVTCEDRLEVLPGGSARGQINSATLVVHEGAYIDSRFQMRREAGA